MSTPSPGACLSCGAALAPGADQCALCGTPAGETDALAPDVVPEISVESGLLGASAVTCATCGHANPPAAKFCNHCGAALAAEPVLPPSAPEASGERPPSDVGRRAMAFVGIAIGAVVLLYAAQALLGSRGAPETQAPAGEIDTAQPIADGPVPPLTSAQRQTEADAFETQGTAEGLYEAGRYYLTDAYAIAQENPENSVRWAREGARLFEASLALEDTDQVRLALAEALRVDPQRSAETAMRPVQEVQTVLQRSPDNTTALFILGELRLERSQFDPAWRDSARVVYERVVDLAEPTDPARLQAIDRLAQLNGATPEASGAE